MNQSNSGSVPVMRFIQGAEGPPSSIREMLSVPSAQRDVDWLRTSLQMAIELELSTIPPYLCGLWSIVAQSGPVYDSIDTIVLEEMGHMGLACNMLTTIGSTPQINTAAAVPKYPGHLPGGVRPQLTVSLVGLSKQVVLDTYMEIEHPEFAPVALFQGLTFPTIGAFYDAILLAFRQVPPGTITGARQLTSNPVGVFPINTLPDAEKAIQQIKEQGEGTSQSPFAVDFGNEKAHFYRFGEIFHGRTLIQTPDHHFAYVGTPIPFPDVFPMAVVPPGGYPESATFDKLYTSVLDLLQNAWQQGSQAQLGQAIRVMRSLADPARELMQKPRPDGKGNFGPSFLLIPDSTGGPMTNIRYADILAYLDAIMSIEHGDIEKKSPHLVFWHNPPKKGGGPLSYHDFTTGNVPGLEDDGLPTIPIMDTANPLQSAFYVILTNKNGLQFQGASIQQMPEKGPFITDPGYKTKLANGTEITGQEIMDNMKSWLENHFPEK
jgi:Ferritin-like